MSFPGLCVCVCVCFDVCVCVCVFVCARAHAHYTLVAAFLRVGAGVCNCSYQNFKKSCAFVSSVFTTPSVLFSCSFSSHSPFSFRRASSMMQEFAPFKSFRAKLGYGFSGGRVRVRVREGRGGG